MPTLLTPPNPRPSEDDEQSDGQQTAVIRSRRFGELNEHELIRLLDTIDDEAAKARFRESIYISVIVCMAIGWFIFYGPQVIFHQPRLIDPAAAIRQHEKDLTFLDTPPDLSKLTHKPTDKIAEKPHTQQTPHPELDKKTLDQLKAMRGPVAPQPTPAPAPQQAAPQQQAPQQQQPAPKPLPQAPPQQQAMVDAPTPTTRPNFGSQQSAGAAIEHAARSAARGGGGGADYDHAPAPHGGMSSPVEVLSDTEGVDFGPYLTKIIREIKAAWYPLIPEEAQPPLNKQGETQIRITILPDGRLHVQDGVHNGMVLEGSTHDDALNRAAWGSITSVGQFPPLPKEFHGPELVLRIHYLYNIQPR
jgi:outer membrane biosynthesis protein TonB